MKKFKSILAIALALTLCLCLALPAVAAEGDAAPAAYISKDLKIAAGTSNPEFTFKFVFTPDNGKSVGIVEGEHPELGASVTYTAKMADAGENEVITLVTGNIIDGVKFPHAGVYAYTVKETCDYKPVEGETLINDTNEYMFYVYVINGKNDELIVDDIFIFDVAEDGEEDAKISSTDDGTQGGKNTTDINENQDAMTNGFRFTNTYSKKAETDPITPPGGGEPVVGSLVISKDTVGEYADRSKDFTFTLNVTRASTDYDSTAFSYIDAAGNPQTAPFGQDLVFTLHDDQYIVLKDVTAGAYYDVKEAYTADYAASVDVDGKVTNGKEKEDLAVTHVLIGEKGSNAAYTNTYSKEVIPPTGISINNLPFLMLISVSALGLFVMFVSKKRRAEEA